MVLLSRRSMLGITAVVDVALHARPGPVVAKALASRHNLPPRHLETLLQALVRRNILKGVRGPRGGYELARERRRITAGDVVRAIMLESQEDDILSESHSALLDKVIEPIIDDAGRSFLVELDKVTIEDLCRQGEALGNAGNDAAMADFTI
jgi:Rrf2 family transcriptional regulator, iron-sulfur cluster assembly transcription factor